jgi:hypothetical protein
VDEETPEESLSQPPVFGYEVREVRMAIRDLAREPAPLGVGGIASLGCSGLNCAQGSALLSVAADRVITQAEGSEGGAGRASRV